MTEKTSAELEREAEAVRAQMSETADSLQKRLSPGQLIDELGKYLRDSDGNLALHNLKTQVRDNPLPLAMIGAGFAWLFMGSGPTVDRFTSGRREATGAEVWEGASGWAEGTPNGETVGTDRDDSSRSSSVSDGIGSAYSAAAGTASSVARSVADGAEAAGNSAMAAGRRASNSVYDAGSRTRRMLSDTLEQEPLILGALGVAVGAAVGAMLPRTGMEEKYLAPYGDKMRESLTESIDQGLQTVGEVASGALGTEDASQQDKRSMTDEPSASSAAHQGSGQADRPEESLDGPGKVT